jgi:hypothetical protein
MGYDVVVPIWTLVIGLLLGNEARAFYEKQTSKKDSKKSE